MNNYTVYRITNPKGKSYIGISKNIKRRIQAYRNLECKGQLLIYRSLKKYSFSNHKLEILYFNLTPNEAKLIEIALIEVYKNFKKSLNISPGGDQSSKLITKPIVQFSLNGEYIKSWESASEAANVLDMSQKSISTAVSKQSYYAKGYLWIYKNDYDKGIIPYWKHKNKTTLKKEVHQYDRLGNYIQSFESVELAARELGYKPNTVKASCIGKSRKSKDFIFSYERKEIEPYPYLLNGGKKASKTVYVYDKDFNLLGTSVCATAASVDYNINRATVYNALQAKNRIVNKKYRFSYEQY